MPLPENGIPWPPPASAAAAAAMREHAAWYSGDPDALTSFYTRGDAMVRPVQREDGVRGRIARWWWGSGSQTGSQRSHLHMPLPSDIATTSADLLFAAPLELTSDNDGLQAFLDTLVVEGLESTLHEGAEVGAALGGTGLAVRWDSEVSGTAWLEAVHADCVHPTFRGGRLASIMFAQRLPAISGSSTVWRQIEVHEPGRILYGLYAGTEDRLGRAVPLAERPETEHLADVVDAEGGQDTGTSRLTATYVPNMLPNRLHRASKLGRSDYQGVETTFDALDEAFSSWHRDIRLGKARLIVPQSVLETNAPGSPGLFDSDREVMVGLHLLMKDGQTPVTPQQFAIRYAEHADTVRDWTNMAVRAAGYSVATMGESGDVAMTATEAEQRERRSYLTRSKKLRHWQPRLRDMLEVAAEVTTAQLAGGVPEDDISVEFGKPAQDTPLGLANTAQALSAAQAASTDTLVRMVHPDWSNDQVDAEVERIRDANRLETLVTPDGISDDAGV